MTRRALRRLLPLLGVFTFVSVVAPVVPADGGPRSVQACAFATPPTTYEALEDRSLYMAAMDLAGNDMLFPQDRFFSQAHLEVGTRNNRAPDDLYIPPTLLKAISWIESVATQGAPDLPFGAIGPALVSFDCGYGVAQVTSGMTAPLGEAGDATDEQALVATHFAYNIGRGAAILADKWNSALRDLELQRLHWPRRQPQQPPDGPDLRRVATHVVQLRPRERRPQP
jgi:hypothetical protein